MGCGNQVHVFIWVFPAKPWPKMQVWIGVCFGGVFRGMFRGMFWGMFRSAGLLTKVTLWGFVSGYVSKHVKYMRRSPSAGVS